MTFPHIYWPSVPFTSQMRSTWQTLVLLWLVQPLSNWYAFEAVDCFPLLTVTPLRWAWASRLSLSLEKAPNSPEPLQRRRLDYWGNQC